MKEKAPLILVLAAGKGTRMKSALPKILHPILFRPMVHYVLDAAKALGGRSIGMVVGHGAEEAKAACSEYGVEFYLQERQLGTGHAVKTAEGFLRKGGTVVLLSGDTPLIRPETLTRMLEAHESAGALVTVSTAVMPDPKGYGRIIGKGGAISDIREEKDASEEERGITEVNGGIYCFDSAALLEALAGLSNNNSQGEYYLTDTIRALAKKGKTATFRFQDLWELFGVNDRAALAEAEAELRLRVNRAYMLEGAAIQDPKTTHIDPRCRLERDTRIEAGVILVNSTVAAGTVVEAGSRIVDSRIGASSRIKQGSCVERSTVGDGVSVGPYAHLRPETELGNGVKIGNFVETKKAVFAAGAKASHLSYIGDAKIGRDVNIGCGFITCNYDGGPVKLRTVIEDGAFIGSDSQAVAPVTVGAGAYVATGTTITEDVPADALAISRGRQVNKPGYAKKLKGESK
jgi:bifunctional UDP-N-acetylglucosamine pyrophosphorylase/glucosamine-1-phosphate N-acetyltransferase